MKDKRPRIETESDGVYVSQVQISPMSVRDKHSDWLERYRNGQSMSSIERLYGAPRGSVWYVVRKKYGVKS